MIPGFDLSKIDPKAQLEDLDRAEYEQSLYEFMKAAWRCIDASPWKDSWAVDAICEHLQAVVDGQIKNLIINCPPRIGKSSVTSVAFPAWTWAQPINSHTSGPGVQFLYASYADKLSLRDSVKCRRLIESVWYQKFWKNRFELVGDNNTKSRFSNNQGGERLITSIGSGVTGEGGNIICIDDPNAANEMLSEATTEATLDWWKTTLPTRRNDLDKSAIVLIQQRLAENDLTGHILEHESDGWTHLCLPGRYEPERSFVTTIGWRDPRTEPGELLWPERFSEAALKRLEVTMGPWTFAGQIQQRPEPKGGGIIRREWWQLWDRETFPPMDFVIMTLDTAYTTLTQNDPSATVVWGIFSGDTVAQANRMIGSDGRPVYIDRTYSEGVPKVMTMASWVARLELHELVEKVAKTAKDLKVDVLMIENKASGISVAQEIRRLYANEKFSVRLFDPKSQDKMARLYSVQHLFAEGLVYAPDRKWAEEVMKQCAMFPKSTHDDLVDCVSMGLRTLRDMGLLTRAPERLAEIEEMHRYRSRAEPLYPVYICSTATNRQ
jgi:predicted phage terminase large subunit-like protein